MINPGVPKELTFFLSSGDLQLAHWGSWSLEPIGADVPLRKYGTRKSWRRKIQPLLLEAAEQRKSLQGISSDIVRLCACCSAFEVAFNKQKYADAIALIPDMLSCLPQSASLTEVPREPDRKVKDS
ncbi:hypothetical protein Q427_23785 [Halomonas sp. BC04]|nr:hypothetical protein Q427_23785 [Halomonas sp. BC04]